MVRWVKLLFGAVVALFSFVAAGIGVQSDDGLGVKLAAGTFFVGTGLLGLSLIRANWKVERAHEAKLDKLLDAQAQARGPAEGSAAAGPADPPEQPR